MDPKKARELVDKAWDGSIIQTLVDYIRIPNKSPLFDPDWRQHGYMDQAVTLIEEWCRAHAVEGMKLT